MGAVGVEENPLGSFAFWKEAVPYFELAVLGVGAAEGPVHVNAIACDGHGEEAVSQTPDFVVVLGHAAHGVSAGVGGVVPGAVVVNRPVHELQVAVGAWAVDVEEVGQRHFADAELDAAHGDAGGQRKGARFLAGGLPGETDDLVNLISGQIGRGTEGGVAHHVKIGEARQAQGLAEAAAARAFEVQDQVGVIADGTRGTERGVERAQQRGLVRAPAEEAVGSLVGGMKRQVALENNVGLAGEPVAAVFRVRRHGDDGGFLALVTRVAHLVRLS